MLNFTLKLLKILLFSFFWYSYKNTTNYLHGIRKFILVELNTDMKGKDA